MTSIILCMIVRQEGKIIKRCLEAALPFIDGLCICDTGSTDDTIAIINEFIAEHKLPGKILKHEFKNFEHNRTLSFKAGVKFAKQNKFKLKRTYALFIDADMVIKTGPDFNKNSLDKDGYTLVQVNPNLEYLNLRLARMNCNWKCIGVTHEFWGCDKIDGNGELNKNWGYIDDRNDGGCKSDKFERDIRLLTQGLIDEPTNGRYMFYLAQSYKDSGEFKKAIAWYTKRINIGGWEEEIWYSHYMIAKCWNHLGNWPRAMERFLHAYEQRPTRIEPLFNIVKHYREIPNCCQQAYIFCKTILGKKMPKDSLFVEAPLYYYELAYELSIIAFYVGQKEEGLLACDHILHHPKAPPYKKDGAHRNSCYYFQQVKWDQKIEITFDVGKIPGTDIDWKHSNPSIYPKFVNEKDDGYYMIGRTVNYEYQNQNITYLQPDGVVNTLNYLLTMDSEFKITSFPQIEDKSNRPIAPVKVLGFEDCRLFEWKGELWFTCCVLDSDSRQLPQIALCKTPYYSQDGKRKSFAHPVEENKNPEDCKIEKFVLLKGPDPNRCEKNWIPFVKNDQVHILYMCNPVTILKVDTETGDCKEVHKRANQLDFSRFRGSSTMVNYKNGWLFIIHEVIFTNVREYINRFVYMDQDFIITRISSPFKFGPTKVEFCCGLCYTNDRESVAISHSQEDTRSFIGTLSLETVEKMMREI
jgi:glycosyltransferase involved in cell wall biosynthesis/predicted GH43/DUF377 family glycosyl hydrolase